MKNVNKEMWVVVVSTRNTNSSLLLTATDINSLRTITRLDKIRPR